MAAVGGLIIIREGGNIRIFQSAFTSDWEKKIRAAAANNHSIQTIRLPSCHLSDNVAPALQGFLLGNKGLKELDLAQSTFSDEGANKLLMALTSNQGLQYLSLPGSTFTDEQVYALCDFIYGNPSEKYLNSENQLKFHHRTPDPNPYTGEDLAIKLGPSVDPAGNVVLSNKLRDVLKHNRVYLVENIYPYKVLDYLRQWNSLTEDQEDRIKLYINTRQDQVRELLDMLLHKSKNDYENFKRALINSDQEDIARHLTEAENET